MREIAEKLLNDTSKRLPKIWKVVDSLRADPPYPFPNYIFLPLEGWYAALCQYFGVTMKELRANEERKSQAFGAVMELAFVIPWRITRGVYKFHPEMERAITSTPISGDLPTEIFKRLPEWSIYIEYEINLIKGFFAIITQDVKDSPLKLGIYLNEGGEGWGPVMLPLGPWSIREIIKKTYRSTEFAKYEYTHQQTDILTRVTTDLLNKIVPMIIYICSQEPEYKGGVSPQRPKPKRVKKSGMRLFPANKNRVWELGYETGEKLEKAREFRERMISDTERKRPIPHIRRAHWHSFWKKKGDEKVIITKWLPPTTVNQDLFDFEDEE